MGNPYIKRLRYALADVDAAKAAVRENRGFEKEQARAALDACIDESLAPALKQALDEVTDPKVIEKVARIIMRSLEAEFES